MVKICCEKYPDNSEYESFFNQYSFSLSDFQKYAIEAIVKGQHVLVTAHTGSGKTLPAEFALNFFVEKGKKLIYTSPIKALSNQKYSEFCRKYPHISFGLMTGDIKINPDADVLIMTTEILMNYLFIQTINEEHVDNSLDFNIDVYNELGCVVFDEVHYINDADRGQTWEKTILMLPKHIQMIMLSATIDSPERFAKWAERGDDLKEVYLATTYKRVVPLTHYGYLTVNEGAVKLIKDKETAKEVRSNIHRLIKLQDDKGVFNDDGYDVLYKMNKLYNDRSIYVKRKHALNNLALYLKENEMLPAIAFVFSRKLVETCASEITVSLLEDDSKIPYTVRKECEQIIRKLPNFKEYLELPEYETLVRLLEKGIGIHHSGMIPILREIVEIMISKKNIKMLFATESFAIGLDCPIKTAVFTNIMKFDGRSERLLLPHEYTQMAGRAGRRGIDTIGHVVHCNNLFQLPSKQDYIQIMQGKPQTLVSKFRISFNLILSLIKNNKIKIDDFNKFVENSMVYNELKQEIDRNNRLLFEKKDALEVKQKKITLLKTPQVVCSRYNTILMNLPMSKNKKRKQFEKEKNQILQENPSCENDAKIFQEVEEYETIVRNQEEDIFYLENYISENVFAVCDVLKNKGFLSNSDTDYGLTETGKIASDIAEVHPLILTNLINHTNWFSDQDVEEIIGILSVFTDVNVAKDVKEINPKSNNYNILKNIEFITEQYEEYNDLEYRMRINSGIQYQDALSYDMPDLVVGWCFCDNEIDCKRYLQNNVADKTISTGDFTKALLKISTIVRELSSIAEKINNVECLQKLTQVDSKILKYITTSQSLYI
jgi:superfamily II RNA helicase